MARWYAERAYQNRPWGSFGVLFADDAPEREIRFVEVNELIGDRERQRPEPIDFGVDLGMETEHTLLVLDVTPVNGIGSTNRCCDYREGWSLENAIQLRRKLR